MPTAHSAAFLGNNGSCSLGGFPEYSINVTNVAQIQLAVNIAREVNIRLVIKNTGHDFGAKSTGKGALNLWTHHLKDYEYYDSYKSDSYNGPAFKFGAGIQVVDAYNLAKQKGVTLVGGVGKVRTQSHETRSKRHSNEFENRLWALSAVISRVAAIRP